MRPFTMAAAAALTCASLTLGCTEARYYQGVIHEAAAEAKDLEATTLAAAPCLIGLGAFFRLDSQDTKRGLVLLCGKGQELPEIGPLE